jgi:hypothetical protein
MSDTPRTDAALRKAQEDCTESYLLTEGLKLERELNAANAEIRSLQYNIDRVIGMYASKDNQICNLLNICRANGIDVSSQDLIHGKEANP